MSEVFLDTVGMIALWDDTDQWHAVAKTAYALLLRDRRRLLTTELVLCECGNASARRPYRQDVCELRRALAGESMLIGPTADDTEQAWSAYERGDAARAEARCGTAALGCGVVAKGDRETAEGGCPTFPHSRPREV